MLDSPKEEKGLLSSLKRRASELSSFLHWKPRERETERAKLTHGRVVFWIFFFFLLLLLLPFAGGNNDEALWVMELVREEKVWVQWWRWRRWGEEGKDMMIAVGVWRWKKGRKFKGFCAFSFSLMSERKNLYMWFIKPKAISLLFNIQLILYTRRDTKKFQDQTLKLTFLFLNCLYFFFINVLTKLLSTVKEQKLQEML